MIINDAISSLISWLAQQQFTPALRELSLAGVVPAAAYPQLLILPREEVFAPHTQDATAFITLRLAVGGGRPADTFAALREIAHQLRSALCGSHNLGGIVKHLKVGSIRYGDQLQLPHSQGLPALAPAVVATAEIDLELKYIVY
jgi:hypothetical protein